MQQLFPLQDTSGLKPLALPDGIAPNLNSGNDERLSPKAPSPDVVERFQRAISSPAPVPQISRLVATIAAAPQQGQAPAPAPHVDNTPSTNLASGFELRASTTDKPESHVLPAVAQVPQGIDDSPMPTIDGSPAPAAAPSLRPAAVHRETLPQTTQHHELPKVESVIPDGILRTSDLDLQNTPKIQASGPKAPEIQVKAPEIQVKAPEIQTGTVPSPERPDLLAAKIQAPKIETAESGFQVAEPAATQVDKPVVTIADKPVATATVADKPAPAAVGKPAPTVAAADKPVTTATVADKPAPTVAVAEKPVTVADKPVTTLSETDKPAPVAAEKPSTVVADKSETVVADKPAPTVAATDKPVTVVADKPAPADHIQQVATARQQPSPANAAEIKPSSKPEPRVSDAKVQADLAETPKVEGFAIPAAVPFAQDAPVVHAASATIKVDIDPSAAAARTSELTEAASAVAETISVTPALARGDGEVVIRLKPDVLDGSEIRLEAKGDAVTIDIRPANAEVAQAVVRSQAQFAQQLAERLPSFQFTVAVATAKPISDRKPTSHETT